MDEFTNDQKIKFRLYDKKNKAHWFDGVIHGVRRYEDPATNAIIKITYLVDTLEDEHVDHLPYDRRDREVSKRVSKMVKTGMDEPKAYAEVLKHTDLPNNKIMFDKVRQPQQIELPAEHIKAV